MKNSKGSLLFGGLIFCWLLLNLAGGIIVKYAGAFHQKYWMLGLLFCLLLGTFGGRAVVSLLIGKRYQLSYAYPFLGLNYVFSLAVGYGLFREVITLPRLAGCALIVAGVFLLMFSRNKEDSAAS